jgi:signal transduction histidine kinase
MSIKKRLLICLFFPLAGLWAGDNAGGITVYGVSEKWLKVDRALAVGADTELPVLIDDFSASLDAFLGSPAYRIYRAFPISQEKAIQSVIDLTANFKAALGEEGALILAADIGEALLRWQQTDGELGDFIHSAYFRLFFVFIGVFGLMAVTVWLLYRALGRSWDREQGRADFSRAVVLAQEQERSRIARELHDSVAQDLSWLALRADTIRQASGAGERDSICAELKDGLGGLMGRVRSICDGLFPPDFLFQGLPDALRRLCHDYGKRTGIDCRIDIEKNLRLDPMGEEMQLQCFRIVQEALANIEKHAGAAEAVVVVRNIPKDDGTPGLFISISDDGKGFAVPMGAGHWGIRGMYERAAILGGHLMIESESGEGTMVWLEVPLYSAGTSGPRTV